jgi:hypothetical protein
MEFDAAFPVLSSPGLGRGFLFILVSLNTLIG